MPGSQMLAMHLKVAYPVIILPSGNTVLLSHKIFRPLRSIVSKVQKTMEVVFVLGKFVIHFACLTPKLAALWGEGGTK